MTCEMNCKLDDDGKRRFYSSSADDRLECSCATTIPTTMPVMASDTAALVEAMARVKRDCPNAPFVPVPIAVAQSLTTRIAELEAENGRLREAVSTIGNPDEQMCCSGHHCGCRGATVGQFAAWCMSDLARATLTETSDDR